MKNPLEEPAEYLHEFTFFSNFCRKQYEANWDRIFKKEGRMSKYVIVDKHTQRVVAENFSTRKQARDKKRELEQAHVDTNDGRKMPSRYFVETGVMHPDGPGIYLH